jgi:hypothetical protein
MPRVELGGMLHEIEDCPDCNRTVLVNSTPVTGFIARCGKRLLNLSECRDQSCKEERDGEEE